MVSNRFVRLTEKLKCQHIISSKAARKLSSIPHPPTADEQALLGRITAPHFGERLFLVNTPKEPFGELWIHWYFLPRTEDKLTRCETFHVNMLCAFDVPNRVEMIHIRCASTAPAETEAMRTAIEALSHGKAKIDFQIVTPKPSWEHDTIKEATEYAASTGRYVYYTHFKGVTRLQSGVAGCVVHQHAGITDINELYWCFLMYWGLFCAFPAGTPVIGPLRYKGICKTFSHKDTGWSKGPGVHCAGSYQAFDGKLLAAEFEKMGMDRERRDEFLWDGDTHIVEMLLTAVFPLDVISSIGNFDAGGAYRAYGRNILPQQQALFHQLYKGAFVGTGHVRPSIPGLIAVVGSKDGPFHFMGENKTAFYCEGDPDNFYYNEVCGYKYLLDNFDNCKHLEYLGLEHYRRAFDYSDKEIKEILRHYDVIVKDEHGPFGSLTNLDLLAVCSRHGIDYRPQAEKWLKQFPELQQQADARTHYGCNMMIASPRKLKEILDDGFCYIKEMLKAPGPQSALSYFCELILTPYLIRKHCSRIFVGRVKMP